MTMSVTPASGPPARPGPPPRSSPPAGAPADRASFGRGVAVLAGWYTTVAIALALWISELPATSPVDDECYGFGCDWSPRQVAVVTLVFLIPVLLVGGGVALVTLFLSGRRLSSAVVTGTLAAAVGLVVTPAVLVLGWVALS